MLKKDQRKAKKLAPQLSERLKKVRRRFLEANLDGLLVSLPPNCCYLTGWPSDPESGFVLITRQKSDIITDSRYSEHAAKETAGFEIIEAEEGIGPALREIAGNEGIRVLGFESHHLSVFAFKRLQRFLKEVKLAPVAHLIEELRATKDEAEVVAIKKVANIADKTFEHILSFAKPGMTEGEVAWEIEKFMRETGAERTAWDPIIVAAGPNSSMAHYGAGDTQLKKEDIVLADFGCVYQGYHSDISRVFFVGKPTDQQMKIYNLVLEAQRLGISLVREGRLGSTIDKKVRSFLEKRLPARQAKNIYRHALGHGVGLEAHELPSVSIRRKNRLVAGNVVTIEPGIYIPGWGGVRIEDMVFVTKEGYKLLTKAPKEIKEITV